MASPGTPLLSLYNPATVRVEARVREGLAVGLSTRQALEVVVPSLNRTLQGVIEEIVPAADPASRSFLVKVGIHYDADLKPGMFARLLVPGREESLILVPETAIGRVGQVEVVWVMEADGPLRRFVKTGRQLGSEVEVVSGLASGEQLLVAAPRI